MLNTSLKIFVICTLIFSFFQFLNPNINTQAGGGATIGRIVFPWYDATSLNESWIVVGNADTTPVDIHITIAGTGINEFQTIQPGSVNILSYKDVIGGPLIIGTYSTTPKIYASQRSQVVINGQKTFNEFPGINYQTITNKYKYTWYDTLNNHNAWLIINNPSITGINQVEVKIAGVSKGVYYLTPNQTIVPEYKNILDGPVEIIATNPVITSQRSIYNEDGKYSFNEYAGLPVLTSATGTSYFTWSDTKSKNRSWVAMVSNSLTPVSIEKQFARTSAGSSIISQNSVTIYTKPNTVSGPISLVSGTNSSNATYSATQRVLYNSSFNEFPAITNEDIKNQIYFPWIEKSYFGNSNGGNYETNSWIMIGNPSTSAITFTVTFGNGEYISQPITVQPGYVYAYETPFYNTQNSAVVNATAGVYATQRYLINGNIFNEYKGIVVN